MEIFIAIISIIISIIVIGTVILGFYTIIKTSKNKNNNSKYKNYNSYRSYEIYPYHSKYLLTKNEYYFYNRLKNITEPLKLQILTKIRLADLIEVNDGLSYAERGTYFNKIKAKHVDFVIADNMKVILIIELDDYSHSEDKTIERDNFVNNALIKSGYTVVRTKGDTEIVRTALVNKGYNPNLYTNTNYYK